MFPAGKHDEVAPSQFFGVADNYVCSDLERNYYGWFMKKADRQSHG